MERAEERLVATTETAEIGEVTIRKRMVEEPASVAVAVGHDEIDVQRVAVDRPLKDGEQPVVTRGDETVLLLLEERLEVRKVPWVVEEVLVRRRRVVEDQEIADTVRSERIDIDGGEHIELLQSDAKDVSRAE